MKERYQRKFVEEAKELLGKLEASLLELENAPNNSKLINEIFRIMHSLKGSGAMFGFSRISNLTHDLENVYSAIRSGQLIVSKHLIDVSFQALDLVRELLKGVEGEGEMNKYIELTEQIQSIIRHKTEPSQEELKQTSGQRSIAPKPINDETSIWLVQFKPHAEIINEGNSPIYMLDEMSTMGEMMTVPLFGRLEEKLSMFDPTKLMVNWNILLASDSSQESILNVFLFVQDASTIKVTRITSAYSGQLKDKESQIKNLLSKDEVDTKNLQALFIQEEKIVDNRVESSPLSSEEKKTEIINSQNIESDFQDSDEITIRVPSAKLDDLMNLVSELITTQGQLSTISEKLFDPGLNTLSEKYEKLIRQLREQSMEMSLVSINTLTVRFKRLVRDLSKNLNKSISLKVEGGETELDKTIIEHLSDPLLHIIRNAIDHGIESSETRKQLGKEETGEIRIRAFYSGAEVHIEISDDGGGIDPTKVLERAIQQNFIENRTQIPDNEILKLLFKPGFSMKEDISEYSGRGVGMDVVSKKILELRGDVEISSKLGSGTKILIKLPLTLTIMDGMLTEVSASKYIVPISSVRKIYEIKMEELKNSFNKLITLDGKQYPFLVLSNEFLGELPKKENLQIILVEYEERKMGLVVDHIIGERQVVLKPLGISLKKNRMFSGGSIMGDGEIALVLDTNKLIREFTTNNNSENSSS
ncbi:MAG: chemotaxis protein CheA [Bacteroidetes bacterium]|nr:chemotaxis protein CheA [Bacteroidota bacterium]MBT4400626.1 chemotaxis protein CheA [Bacteroidota bacterium]MBT4408378.1 chemotaxis protein CheA [Bacteroidota bacterium]MBT7094006.1 chemotaxis protein CheA [Bacteroidota bacterium]MBT7464067.1 chemotaxis protein CheA [Bacteroidota bacterium]